MVRIRIEIILKGGAEMPKQNTHIDIELYRESIRILYHILIANGATALLGVVFFFFSSPKPYDERLVLLVIPGIAGLVFMVSLFVIQRFIRELRTKALAMIFVSYAIYLFTIVFYFYRDTIPMIILMGMLYLYVTQILMEFKFSLLFGVTGVTVSLLLYGLRHGHKLDIGIGFTITLIFIFIIGIFSVYRYIALFRDYNKRLRTQLEALLENEVRNDMIHKASKELIWDLDLIKGTRNFSDAVLNVYGDRLSSSKNIQEWMMDIHPEDAPELYRHYMEIVAGRLDQFEIEFRQVNRIGGCEWYSAKVVSKKDELGNVIRLAGSYTLINDRKLKELEIEYLAYNDVLTDLPNRSAYIRDYDQQQLDQSTDAFLIYLDIQNFREINSTFGHFTGDQILKAIAARLKKLPKDLGLYQITSIDFGLMAFKGSEAALSLAESVVQLFVSPFVIDNQEVFVDVKLGIAIKMEAEDTTAIELLRNADTALYHCRKDPSVTYRLYSAEMTEAVASKMNLSNLMRQALEHHEFYVVFQPITNVVHEKPSLYGFEALVRWNSIQLGHVRPDEFIPIAEETGMIMQLGDFVLAKSCEFIKEICEKHPELIISVNLSAKQIGSDHFLPNLFRIVEASGINPHNLCLEITETSFIESFEEVSIKFETLKAKGYLIALDDFGTGYSSLNYLGQLQIDTLKIDKSFTTKITTSKSDYYLIKSVIALSKDLGIQFVAEGVETDEQLSLLKSVDCPLIQGYLFEKPLPRAEAMQYPKRFKNL